ncbi:MAG: Ig-like domain repeat protein [Pseudonocardiaceae bacterium]
MPKNRSTTLLWSVAVVIAVLVGVAFLTMGRSLLTGGLSNAAPPAHQIMATTTTLTTSEGSPAAQGIQVALTATVTPATAIGTVQFKDGATNLGDPVIVSNGTASGTTSSLAAGSHSLTAVFIPARPVAYAPSTTAYSPSTSPAVMFVIPGAIATSTALATSPATQAASGTPVTLTATVTPATAVGTVQFKDATTNLGNPVIVTNGTASGSTSALAVGSHSLTAVFTPTNAASFVPSTSPPVTFAITAPAGAAATSTALTTSPASQAASGTPVTLTATVTPATALGVVQFKDGTANLGNPVAVSNGAASGTTSTLAAGSRSLTAVFTPATPTAFSPSTSPSVTFVITGTTGATATSTALATSQASPVRPGTAVTLTATISPATAIGTVQFKDGTTNLGNPVVVTNGTASGTTANLAVGSHQLTAVFTPTDPAVFGPSTSPVLPFVVTENPALAQLRTCLTAIGNCQPRAGTRGLDHPDQLDAGSGYALSARSTKCRKLV